MAGKVAIRVTPAGAADTYLVRINPDTAQTRASIRRVLDTMDCTIREALPAGIVVHAPYWTMGDLVTQLTAWFD